MKTKTVHQNNDEDKCEPVAFVLGMNSAEIFYLNTLNFKVF